MKVGDSVRHKLCKKYGTGKIVNIPYHRYILEVEFENCPKTVSCIPWTLESVKENESG